VLRNVRRQRTLFYSLRLFTNFICLLHLYTDWLYKQTVISPIAFILISINSIISFSFAATILEMWKSSQLFPNLNQETISAFSSSKSEITKLHWHDFQVQRIFTWRSPDGNNSNKADCYNSCRDEVRLERIEKWLVAFTGLERGSKGETRNERERPWRICRFSVPFRCPAVTMPPSNCSLFSDRTLPRRSSMWR